ncbi:hypothetical protein D3C84_1102330 [compost metagenome]
MEPATTPGSASGSIRVRKVWAGVAPRSLLASKRDRGIRSTAAWMGRIMKGSQT